jgi:hypothetical protein
MRVLENPAHLHLHLVDGRLGIANLFFHLARGAEQGTKLTRPPTGKSGLVLPLEMVPTGARLIEARHHIGAIGGRSGAQRLLIEEHKDTAG